MPDIFVDQNNQNQESVDSQPKKRVRRTVKKIQETVQETTVVPEECPPVEKNNFWSKLKQPLRAYVFHPSQMHFESQEEKEEVILLLRRHPVTNVPWIVTGIILFLVPIVIFPILSVVNIFPFLPMSYQFIFTMFWYIGTFGVTLVNYLSWFYNINLVTSQRIVDVDFRNLVYRQLASTRISKVQDVTYKVTGVIRSVFDYGDVYVQTAGTEENFIFDAVPMPQQVVKTIGNLIEKKESDGNSKPGV